MKHLLMLALTLLVLNACTQHTTGPQQPGWIDADQWQARIERINAGQESYDPRDDIMSRYTGTRPPEGGNSPRGVYIPRRSVTTYCYSSRRYTRCSTY